jgi:hypothetical protein
MEKHFEEVAVASKRINPIEVDGTLHQTPLHHQSQREDVVHLVEEEEA